MSKLLRSPVTKLYALTTIGQCSMVCVVILGLIYLILVGISDKYIAELSGQNIRTITELFREAPQASPKDLGLEPVFVTGPFSHNVTVNQITVFCNIEDANVRTRLIEKIGNLSLPEQKVDNSIIRLLSSPENRFSEFYQEFKMVM